MPVILLATIVLIFGWVIDFFSVKYWGIRDTFEGVWFGVISGTAFLLIVVPWLAALMSVFGLINTLVLILKGRVKLFEMTCERIHTDLISNIRAELQRREESRDDVRREAKKETEIEAEEKISASKEMSEGKQQSGGNTWRLFGQQPDAAELPSQPEPPPSVQDTVSTNAIEVVTHDSPLDVATDVRDIIEVYSCAAGYPEMHHEAYVLLREIQLASKEFDWIIGLLLVVCTAVVLLTSLSFFMTAKNLKGKPMDWALHYLARDVFNLAV